MDLIVKKISFNNHNFGRFKISWTMLLELVSSSVTKFYIVDHLRIDSVVGLLFLYLCTKIILLTLMHTVSDFHGGLRLSLHWTSVRDAHPIVNTLHFLPAVIFHIKHLKRQGGIGLFNHQRLPFVWEAILNSFFDGLNQSSVFLRLLWKLLKLFKEIFVIVLIPYFTTACFFDVILLVWLWCFHWFHFHDGHIAPDFILRFLDRDSTLFLFF